MRMGTGGAVDDWMIVAAICMAVVIVHLWQK